VAVVQTISIDIDPGQLVHWLEVECAISPSTLKITASRSRSAADIPVRSELHLGDAEREDLSEVATIGALEITPAHDSGGWKLTVIVEDEVGPRLLDGGAGDWPEQAIDLGTFAKEFIRSGRGTANVFAELQDAAAVDRVQQLISTIEADRHPSSTPLARGAAKQKKKIRMSS